MTEEGTHTILLKPKEKHLLKALTSHSNNACTKTSTELQVDARQLKIKTKIKTLAHTAYSIRLESNEKRKIPKQTTEEEKKHLLFSYTCLDPETATGEGYVSAPHLPKDNCSPRS